MRVLLDVSAVPHEPRGAGVYVLELAAALARRRPPDLELVLLARKDDRDRWQALADGESRPTVLASVPRRRPLRLAWEQVAGPHTGRRQRVDVWHGPHYTLPLRGRFGTVVTVHDLTLLEHPEWHERAKTFYFGHMIPAAVARATACVCVSAHTARRLEALVPAPSGTRRDVTVIPHGVDHERFRPVDDPATDLARLDRVGVRPPYVAFLGTMEPRKDVPSVVDAFARAAPAHPDLRLVLAGGSGWDGGAVQRAIAASGVAHRIVRTGYLPDDTVPSLLRRAGAVVYPSFEEGFGLPALEALACGAPVVTTAGSSVEEFVGDAALLVPPGDAAALSHALDRALDPLVRATLSARGPRQAAPYTWEAAADAHLEVYRRVAERGG